MKFAFPSADGAALECVLNFDEFEYANLDFFDHARGDVLLHLSFRFRRQVVVYNQYIAGEWGPERPTPLQLQPDGNRLRIEFFLGIATVVVNEVKVGAFELPEPSDGTDFALHFVSVNGAGSELTLSGEAYEARQGRGLIVMDRPFLLEGWGFDPGGQEQQLAVTLAGTEEALPLAVIPSPERAQEQQAPSDRIGVMALVPGWIWTYATGDEVAVQLMANGRPCGTPVAIGKDEVAQTIEALCDGDISGNTLEALTALEHVRFGDLSARLSSNARQSLADVARRFEVTEFFLPAVDDTPAPLLDLALAPPPSRGTYGPYAARGAGAGGATVSFDALMGDAEAKEPSGADPAAQTPDNAPEMTEDEDARLKAVLQKVTKELSVLMDGAQADQMGMVLEGYDLSHHTPDVLRSILLSLSGVFCAADQFAELHRVAGQYGLDEMPPAKEHWAAPCLPFLYTNGRAADLVACARTVVTYRGWVDNSAFAWAVRSAFSERPMFLSEQHREDLLYCFLDYAERHKDDHFGPVPSEDFVTTGVAVLEALPSLSDDMQEEAVRRVLGLYGTSALFWERVAAAEASGTIVGLPRPVLLARQAFEDLSAAIEAGDLPAASASLVRSGLDRPSIRRELAANAQVHGLPMRDALAQGGPWPGDGDDTVLRQLAFPVEAEEFPDLVAESRRAIRRGTPFRARSLHPEVQASAGAVARRLLDGRPLADADRAALLDNFFADCATLGSPRDDHLGQALSIALLTGALTNRDAALVAELPARFSGLLASLTPRERRAMAGSSAVRNALWGLRQAPGAERDDVACAVLKALADDPDALPDPLTPGPGTLQPQTGVAAFHGVLVVVYSCQPNLDSRIPALRETWLADLEERGIPFIVIVGDGDGRCEGDVVYLDAPDSYEALPQKSLAMAEWVLRNTTYSHIFKVDDDCFLNVDQAIGGLSYRRHSYYGRRIKRNPGQMDRMWHHSRGARDNASLELDKSPEPSEYADGGCGYALDRRALQNLVETSNTRHGAWLQLASFMEDKLVGDLLSLTGLGPSDRDYNPCLLRRSHRGGRSVCRWENSFLPSQASPSQVAHLDNVDLLKGAAEASKRALLLPKRIWPSFEKARLGWNNMQLELVSDQAQLDRVNAADLCVVGCVRNERDMLPMFLRHYRDMGVQGFLLSDNFSDDGTLEYLADQPDVAVFSSDTDYNCTQYGVAWQHALMSNLRMNRWSLVADADEFLVLPDAVTSIAALLDTDEFRDADCARIFMLDLYPEGQLAEATLASGDPFSELTHCEADPFLYMINPGLFANAKTWTSALRHRLLQSSRPDLFVAQKYALVRYKPWMRFTAGLHYAAEVKLAKRDLLFAHFKYHAAFHERARVETERGQHFNKAEEYRKYLDLMAEGRDRIFDPAVSVPWRECAWVRRTLAAGAGATASKAAE